MRRASKFRFVLLSVLYLGILSTVCAAQDIRDPDLNRIIERVREIYGLTVHYAHGPESKPVELDYVVDRGQDSQALIKVVSLFVQEINLYPKNFFRDARCRNIYFVRRLFHNQEPVDGVFSARSHDIFYDYSRDSDNTDKIRHNIHHELFHLIGSKHPFWKTQGPAWESLNRGGFSYNLKQSPHDRNPINFHAPHEPGFVTDYAMASPEEDRAEVFSCMMIPEQLDLMEHWARKDNILFKKMALMKEFLNEAF